MKRKIVYTVITGALMAGAFFTGSSIHNGESRNMGNPASEITEVSGGGVISTLTYIATLV